MGCIEQIWCLNNLRKYGTVYLQYVHQNFTGQNNDYGYTAKIYTFKFKTKTFLNLFTKNMSYFLDT